MSTETAAPSTVLYPPSSTRPEQRFTPDGSEELERHLEHVCARVLRGVRGLVPARQLEAVYLGGGYGRGEGGVLATADGERPYNDLEFYVFLRGNRHANEWRHARALEVLGEILTANAGAHVEFKIASRAEFARQPVSMFSYDLVAAHRRLFGAARFFEPCAHHGHAPRIPLAEGTRLLMNRFTGLLLARERLDAPAFTPADADFVRRNLAKAELALGDAVLVAQHRYHWSAKERHRRLRFDLAHGGMPEWRDAVLRFHAAGVQFKFHPERSGASRETLCEHWEQLAPVGQLVWLWLEALRLGTRFPDARAYALDPRPKFPELRRWRGVLATLKQSGPRTLLSRDPFEPVRERLVRALALLLWAPGALAHPRTLARLQRELQTDAIAAPAFARAYLRLWERAR
ncbi:MAG: hypothetical protein HYV96_11370 [Opitutae bacterium]|nr:hypothetical protein [Opitutae bacterium]